jgi:hypothetical protein
MESHQPVSQPAETGMNTSVPISDDYRAKESFQNVPL